MAILEYNCEKQSLAYYGCFKLLEYPSKISAALDNLFSEIFVDPWENWNLIRRIFESFGVSNILSMATFSKSELAGDGGKTQWRLDAFLVGILVQCYNIAVELDILVDPDACKITYTLYPDDDEKIARKKWQALASQYQIIKDVQMTQNLVAFGIAPLFNLIVDPVTGIATSYLGRSTQQLQLYQSSLVKTNISVQDQYCSAALGHILYRISKETLDNVFSELLPVLTNGWWNNLLTLDAINVEYEDYTIIHTSTADGWQEFDVVQDATSINYISHIIYIMRLPNDDAADPEDPEYVPDVSLTEKLCYGLEYGQHSGIPPDTFVCATCYYGNAIFEDDISYNCQPATTGRNSLFLNPVASVDPIIPNYINLPYSSVPEGKRVKIKYKAVRIIE